MPLPVKIEHRIGVQAPPEEIWRLVCDIPGWPRWNPLYPKAEGELQFGRMLTLEVAIPGEPRRTIRPTVADWTPNEQIIWRLSRFGGLMRSTRFIEIEKLADESCIFSNGEIIEGTLVRLIDRRTRRAIKAGFAAMGEAVRDRAEAAFRSAEPAAT
ncbi:MAG TPA: SRPBCC domain-containing protein [Caulobacteraceae bacterium]|nr:SRPBCC domain-containing protein [Caulobacteraceae bacterium]